MKRTLPCCLSIATLWLTACVAHVHHDAPPPSTPSVPVQQYGGWDDEETRIVIYREYYGCSDEEIYYLPHYRRYYMLEDSDVFFLLFMARHLRLTFAIVSHSFYYDCARDHHRFVHLHRVNPAIFFIDIP